MPSLDTLPPEILFTILSYTSPTLHPTLPTYALNTLASTSKHLHAIVEEYARNLLKRHASIVLPPTTRVWTCRRKWLATRCQYCNKASKRKACFYKRVVCCSACDKIEFEKMTMTQATQTYHLSKLDLFTPSPLHPTLPPLTAGLYPSMGGTATMFSTLDVLARAAHIRGLLGDKADDEAYMRVRPATHDRVIKHLRIQCHHFPGWRPCLDFSHGDDEVLWAELTKKYKQPKSMRTEESRRAYAAKVLGEEWEAMGGRPLGDYMGCVRGWVVDREAARVEEVERVEEMERLAEEEYWVEAGSWREMEREREGVSKKSAIQID